MKLYRVTLKGMCSSRTGTAYGNPYVLANDPTAALKKVQEYLDANNIGFKADRIMHTIELLAEDGGYPNCKIQLFL